MTVGGRDPITLALGGIATGATAGASIMTVGAIVLRTLQPGADGGFAVLTAGVMTGLAVAAATAALVSRGVAELWRRGAAAMSAAFGACLLALLAAPADMMAGRVGLAVYLVVLVAAGLWAWGRTRGSPRLANPQSAIRSPQCPEPSP